MTPRRLIEPARLASTAVLRGQSDERLIDLTRAGNERAFEAIVQRYRRPLLQYCSRILPPARAEDAVQQAFLSAYNAIAAGDRELKLKPWLYRIAHNSALNLLRQNGWNHEQLDEQFDGVVRAAPATAAPRARPAGPRRARAPPLARAARAPARPRSRAATTAACGGTTERARGTSPATRGSARATTARPGTSSRTTGRARGAPA